MDKLIDEKAAASILGIAPISLRKQRCVGVRPGEMPLVPFVKLGSRVRYSERSLQDYIAALPTVGEGAR